MKPLITLMTVALQENVWEIPLDMERRSIVKWQHVFQVDAGDLEISMYTNSVVPIALKMGYDANPVDTEWGTLCAGGILVCLNILIISEVGLH